MQDKTLKSTWFCIILPVIHSNGFSSTDLHYSELNHKQAKYVQTVIQTNQIYFIFHFQMLRNFSPLPNSLSTA